MAPVKITAVLAHCFNSRTTIHIGKNSY